MDKVLGDPAVATLIERFGRERVKAAIRDLQAPWRQQQSFPESATEPQHYANMLEPVLAPSSYQRVINLTGTVIHTNLGRSLLSKRLWRETEDLVTEPMNLEYDLRTGRRGKREQFVVDRLCALTGAESACVVNNCAAALMLTLNTLALGKEVPVSRGELIEIGGSFRLPDIMQRSGCTLVEVGTTNRTHEHDYRNAITANTSLLLKVHPSNYQVEGFSKVTDLRTLATLAQEHDLPLVEDLGSGTLIDLTRYGLPAEPTPQQSLNAGADLVMFSGDKLLGSVQAGIVVGKRRYIEQLNSNPLKRALRLDKVALTLLDKTLALYEQPELLADEIPLLKTLTTAEPELRQRAEQAADALRNKLPNWEVSIEASAGQIGSGALPTEKLASVAVVVTPTINSNSNATKLAEQMRQLRTPLIGRVHRDALWLDMRGAHDMQSLIRSVQELSHDH